MAEVIPQPSGEQALTLSAEEAASIWGTNKPQVNPGSTEVIEPKADDKVEPVIENKDKDGKVIPVEPIISMGDLATKIVEKEKTEPIVDKNLPVDLGNNLKKLFEEEVLFGFSDDKGELEIPKTIEDLKEVIKANKEEWKKEFQTEFEKNYTSDLSPQIASILEYGKKGGTNIEPLLQRWVQAEKISGLDETKPLEAEKIYKAYKEAIGETEEDYADELQLLKDGNKLTTRAANLKPKLIEAEEEAINNQIVEQQQRDVIAKKAVEQYKSVVKTTLQKGKLGDITLDKNEQQSLFDLTIPNQYRTYSGRGSGFDKIIEDLQFGDKQDYEHYLELVKHASDREGFFKKIKTEVKKEADATTFKQLKTSKSDKSSFVDPNEVSTKAKMLTRVKGMGN